jgi:hypothetical protein
MEVWWPVSWVELRNRTCRAGQGPPNDVGSADGRGSPAHRARHSSSSPHPDLVGRPEARVALDRAVAASAAGEGMVWHLSGEAGIGKTSLIAVTRGRLEQLGVRVLAASAEDVDKRRSFSVFRTLLPNTDFHLSSDPIGYILAQFERLALHDSLAITVDDIHWADPDSLDALAAIARRVEPLGLLLVTAGRPHIANAALHRYQTCLERSGTMTILDGLTDQELDELVVQRTGSRAGPRLREILHGTAGNPFFTVELLSALDEDGSLRVRDEVVDVDATVLPTGLKQRLGHAAIVAAGESAMVLRAAAVIPGGFTIEEMAAVLERPLTPILEDILRLEAARVIEEYGCRLSFRHDIIRQSIVEATPRSIVRVLNRRALAILQERGGDELRIADVLLASADPSDPSDRTALIDLGVQLVSTQPLAAADLLGSVMDHLHDDERALDAVVAYGWALIDSGRAKEVATFLAERSVACGLGVRSVQQLRNHALLLCGDIRAVLDSHQVAQEEAVPSHVGDQDTVDDVAELALFAVVGGRIGRAREAVSWADASPARPRRASRAHLEQARAWLLGFDGRLEAALEAAERCLSLVEGQTSASAQRARPYTVIATMLDALGRSDEALALTRQQASTATPAWNRSILHSTSALFHFRRGEWDDASTEIAAGLLLAEEMDLGLGAVWPYALSALMSAARGDLANAQHWLDRCHTDVPPRSMGSDFYGHGTAVVAEAGGDREPPPPSTGSRLTPYWMLAPRSSWSTSALTHSA